MTSNEILSADLLDIVFDNRNKQYGAYALRKHYNSRLCLSLAIALGSVFLLCFFISPYQEKQAAVQGHKPLVVVQNRFIPEKMQPPQQHKPKDASSKSKQLVKQPVAAQAKLVANISLVKHTGNVMTPVSQLRDAAVGTVNREGPRLNFSFPQGNPGGKPSGTDTARSSLPVISSIQQQPEFPGGLAAWIRYLQIHLRVPAELGAGEQKTVIVRFQVAVDGSITDFEVMQSPGKIYDQEVIRVLKRMPKWRPAIQNGYPVATSFMQPVTFVGLE